MNIDEIRGWMSRDEGAALSMLATDKVVLEMGVFCGKSTVYLAKTARLVHACDWHFGDSGTGDADTLSECVSNLRAMGVYSKVILHVGRFEDIGAVLASNVFDMVLIDGGHDSKEVGHDCAIAKRVLKPGGVIAMHDSDRASVQWARQTVFGEVDIQEAGSLAWFTWRPE